MCYSGNFLRPAHRLKLSRRKPRCWTINGLAQPSLKKSAQVLSRWPWTHSVSEAKYHTLVFAAPRMNAPLELHEIGRLMHNGYWMLDLELASQRKNASGQRPEHLARH